MARPNKPWYRADRDAWVVKIAGKQVVLSKGKSKKQDALKAFYALMLDRPDETVVTVKRVIDFCISWGRTRLERETQIIYRKFLLPIAAQYGNQDACLARPVDAHGWIAGHENWSKATRHMAIKCIKRAWKLAAKEKLIPANNMLEMENPTPPACTDELSEAEIGKMVAAIKSKEFLDLFLFMYETGCRQGEARVMEAKDISVDGHVATLARHKTAHTTQKKRRIYLSVKARAIVSRLCEAHPKGPIFLNKRGAPWQRAAICLHMKHVRERAGLGPSMMAKSLRSHWITDALVNGVPIATVAELAGHSNTRMIEQFYSRLSQRHDYLKQSVEGVRPASGDSSES